MHRKNIKLADFGLSRKVDESCNISKITGTIPYIDPKCFDRNYRKYKLQKESDVYSIGVLLWQISSGREPFKRRDYSLTLAMSIRDGLREKALEGTPVEYSGLYKGNDNYSIVR